MKILTTFRSGLVIAMLSIGFTTTAWASSLALAPTVMWQLASTPECWASPDQCGVVVWVRVPINGTCITANSALWAQAESFTANGQLYDSDAVICERS